MASTRRSVRLRGGLGWDAAAATAAAAAGQPEQLSGVEYLVCWRELGLDQASWEAEEVGCWFVCVGGGGGVEVWLTLVCNVTFVWVFVRSCAQWPQQGSLAECALNSYNKAHTSWLSLSHT